jgi:hypothetical protein
MAKREKKISHWEAVKSLNLKLATKEESEAFCDEARRWQNAGGKCMWDDAGSSQMAAIAEYLANQKGLTLFEKKVFPRKEV